MVACSEISEALFWDLTEYVHTVNVHHPYASQNVRKSCGVYLKAFCMTLHFCHFLSKSDQKVLQTRKVQFY